MCATPSVADTRASAVREKRIRFVSLSETRQKAASSLAKASRQATRTTCTVSVPESACPQPPLPGAARAVAKETSSAGDSLPRAVARETSRTVQRGVVVTPSRSRFATHALASLAAVAPPPTASACTQRVWVSVSHPRLV